MDKSLQRKEYIRIRDSIKESDRRAFSKMIFNIIEKLNVFEKSECILLYADYKSEVITTDFITRLLTENKKKVYLPKVCGDDMTFYQITDLNQIKSGYKGIREPDGSTPCFDESSAEKTAIIIVPGVAFDLRGYRIGYGKGFYDRFLYKNKKIIKLGIAFNSQICKNMISNDSFDICMDYIITEKGSVTINE